MNIKNEKPPMAERKPDMELNGNKVTQAVELQKLREKTLFPLRINRTTIIYVPKEKCTPEYAEKYKREKLNII